MKREQIGFFNLFSGWRRVNIQRDRKSRFGLYIRSHPGPLPQGEGEPITVAGQFGSRRCRRCVVAHRSKIATETEGVLIAQTRTTIHPLLGGEGRGEGGRSSHSSVTRFERKHRGTTNCSRKFYLRRKQTSLRSRSATCRLRLQVAARFCARFRARVKYPASSRRCCAITPKTEIEMGSARASRAVFRALAENLEHTRIVSNASTRAVGQEAGREAHPATPGAGVLPQLLFSGLLQFCRVHQRLAMASASRDRSSALRQWAPR